MKLKTISFLLMAAGSLSLQAAPVQLLAPQAGDMSAPATVARPGAASLVVANPDGPGGPGFGAPQREAVALSWAATATANAAIDTEVKPFLGKSQEYYRKVSGAELNRGVDLHTSSPRALVRLQAVGAIGQHEMEAIQPKFLTVTDSAGKQHVNGAAMESIVDAAQLVKADLPFAASTSAFRLNAAMGQGKMTLKADKLNETQDYLIHVTEPDSPFTQTLQTGAGLYLHGQNLVVSTALLEAGSKKHAIGALKAELVSPSGRVFPLKFARRDGQNYEAQIRLDANETPTPGLWEVHSHIEANIKGQVVRRSTRVALPVALPVARLTGAANLQAGKRGELSVVLGVEAASAGRYEARGLLYGTVGGKLVPLAVAHSAKWIDGGKGEIDLSFNAALLQGSSAPYEVRDLVLNDQGYFTTLHKQARGLTLDATDLKLAGVVAGSIQTAAGNELLNPPVKAGLGK
jgi:Domain of unknown function (DUF4785)